MTLNQAVCSVYGLEEKEIMATGKATPRHMTWARYSLVWIYSEDGVPFKEIAKLVGFADDRGARQAHLQATRLIWGNGEFSDNIDRIRSLIAIPA